MKETRLRCRRPSLRGADTASPQLRVDGPGEYTVRLVVRGDGRESAPDDVVVHVLSGKRGF